MPKAGTYTALQKLKPISIDWGKVAETGIKREDELYERKKAEEKARKEERDKLGYDALEPVITGIDSLDKGLTLGIQEASTMQHEDYKRAMNDPSYADSPEYKIRTKNLNEYSKNVDKFSQGFEDLAQKVITMSQEDKLSDWDSDLLETLNGGFVSEKVKFGVAEDGSVMAHVASTDQANVTEDNPDGYVYDEDGKIKMTKVTPAEVFKGLGKFSVTPEVDIAETAKKIGTDLGKKVTSKIEGFVTTTEQTWESKVDETKKMIRGLLGSPASPTALAKRLWADDMDKKSRKLTEADMNEMEDRLLEKIKPYYDTELKKDKDYAAQSKAIDRADKKKADQASPALVLDTESGKPSVESIPDTDKSGYAVSFGTNTALKLEDTEATATFVKNIYFSDDGVYAQKLKGNKRTGDFVFKDDGNIDIEQSLAQGKGWSTAAKTEKLTMTELTNIAKSKNVVKPDGSNFKNGKELVDFLKNQFKEAGGEGTMSKTTGDFDEL